jgi:hypothetical protein
MSPLNGPVTPADDPVAAFEAAAVVWRALVPVLAGDQRMRVSRDGGRTYPARHEEPLTPSAPPRDRPCTIPVYDTVAGTGRMLPLDLDPARAPGGTPAERVAEVARQAAAITALITGLGGACVTDRAPSGGRHVYVLFAVALPWRELRDVTRALAARFSAVDPAPASSLGGQISPPGSLHKSGRDWRRLCMPLEAAVAAVLVPCGPQVWAGLTAVLSSELAALEPAATEAAWMTRSGPDGEPWLPRDGGPRQLGGALEKVARTGTYDRGDGQGRYSGASEARFGVLCAAAARGWQLAQVREQVESGRWAGLRRLYARRSEPRRLQRLLPVEWRKACAIVGREKNVRHSDTSADTPRPPAGCVGCEHDHEQEIDPEYGELRQQVQRWITATDCAVRDPRRAEGWGGHAVSVRLVLAALGQAAIVSGSLVLEFGVRNLALYAGLSHETVATVLGLLRDEPDPLIDLVLAHKWERADLYMLRVPAGYAEAARWRRPRAGRIEAIHCVFASGQLGGLGGTAALVYQELSAVPERGAELARAACLSSTAVSDALRVLAEHGLAERTAAGWVRGPARLADVADATGAAGAHADRVKAYAKDRDDWHAIIGSWLTPSIPADAIPAPWIRRADEDLSQLHDDGDDAGPGPPRDDVGAALRVLFDNGLIDAREAERVLALTG